MRCERTDGHYASDATGLIDLPRVHRWISEESYWATGRSIDDVRRSIENSIAIGLYDPAGEQLGFCRWVTDRVSFAWLCDVFVDRSARRQGFGQFLIQSAMSHEAVEGLRLQLLATRDAHGFYRRFGFSEVDAGRFMERRRSDG